jgi:hypothetical protein
MKDEMYLCGSTVRLIGEFFDFEGKPKDVQFPKVIIYDYKYKKVAEYPLSDSNKVGVGKYSYDYITTENPTRVIYEFNGESDSLPALDRGSFTTLFMKHGG